ncbi:endolytic transglycosylase MltG [Candidatus Symbiobacter mobilis]|uniref:endolytic transglycosylase MltG n=1 Tax=Candidatus Symbiobacter mobilis TaxID=1436290 RepID=UPI00059C4302|nr:endolytic transglycosylase MltG [Candidatus Symbiobacter mobilis]
MRIVVGWIVVVALGVAGWARWWVDADLELATPTVEVLIPYGMSPRDVAVAVVDAGVQTPAWLLYAWFRLSGKAPQLKAGNYEWEAGVTPRSLLARLVRGDISVRAVTLVEGWNLWQCLQALSREEHLQHDAQGLEPSALMKKLGRPGKHPEGRFFPDTYHYTKGSSELALLRRALRAMDTQLAQAWRQRVPQLAVSTPEEALILASIIEKETGTAADRTMISSVFHNRLRRKMPLQSDPTVIYGMWKRFDGNLRKRDLQESSPWNTYTRAGLPPTPIAMPGKAALLAAVQPARSAALYFVARGDGSSQFSNDLSDHNRAVNRYQRGR